MTISDLGFTLLILTMNLCLYSVIGSSNRLEVLRILHTQGPLSYSELKTLAGFRSKKESSETKDDKDSGEEKNREYDSEDEFNLSLAAMEEEIKPKVISTFNILHLGTILSN